MLSLQRLREGVIRDLTWLFNTSDLASCEDLDEYPEVAKSVINYGMPDLTGKTAAGLDVASLEKIVRQAILDFEPRILRESVIVRAVVADGEMTHNAISFEIEGQLWAQPLPLQLYLKTEMDLETGDVKVSESSAGGRD